MSFERVGHSTLGPVWYRWNGPQGGMHPGFAHAIFTRLGGVSQGPFASLNLGGTVGDDPAAVEENHRRVLSAVGCAGRRWVSPHQVHSNRVAVVSADDLGRVIEATDALVTHEPGVPLLLRFADCVPVLLFDPRQKVVAVAHAGWRGVAARVVPATIETMVTRFGTRARDLWAGIGPAIGPDHYAVGAQVVRAVSGALPEGAVSFVASRREGADYLDLARAVAAQLTALGVVDVSHSGLCTACHTGEWFSHRAEAGVTGRFGVLAMLI